MSFDKKCTDCKWCFMEPDDDFTCGHEVMGLFGLYVKHARKPGGECGPDAKLFEPRGSCK